MAKQINERQWYRMPVSTVLQAVGSSEGGLDSQSVNINLKNHGYIKTTFAPKWLRDYFTYNVIRDGSLLKIASDNIVFGDIITLNKGDVVPALMRVVKVRDANLQEQNFTGSSALVSKNSFAIRSLLPIGQQKNMLFPGTYVVSGQVVGVVVGNLPGPKISKARQSKKLAKHGLITSTSNAKKIYSCSAVIFEGLTKTKDIKDSFRLLYINNHIPCLYLTSKDGVKRIVSEMPEVQLLSGSSSKVDPGVYVLPTSQKIDSPVRNFINNYKVLYIGPGMGQNPVSIAASVAIVAGNNFEQISLLNTQALATGISAKNLSSILYNKK